jgi:hypothetical protein
MVMFVQQEVSINMNHIKASHVIALCRAIQLST